ncbi:membrane protein [Terasakiella brassicae]|uniref:Membrane protein n=1 Tax=Terasakiella brassicae TaxID=1634917 RepID=A0A917FCS3_9PROT|nr:DMT family transporter [Terasakiella brassicae]GGF71091.1 membrane protein [Terasakiella brassicae]
MQQRPDHIQGLIFATLGALSLTPDGLLVRLVDAHDWTIVFWRGLIIACCLFLYQIFFRRRAGLKALWPAHLKEWLCIILAGFGTLFFVLSITHTTVANALVILSTMSLFAALLSLIFLKERIALRTIIAMGCAIIGIIIVFIDNLDTTGLNGKLFALACAFVTAANMTVIRSEKNINVLNVFAWGGIVVCIPTLYLAPYLVVNVQSLITLGAMGGLNAFAFVMLGLGAKYIPSAEVSLLMLLETIIGPIWVWAVLNEIPSSNAVIGGGIVVGTLALHSLASLRAHKRV